MEGQFLVIKPTEKNLIITASIGLVSPIDNSNVYILIRNKRGWDLPGGHVKKNETPLQAFRRELKEEANCILLFPIKRIAILKSKIIPITGIVVYRGFCRVLPFNKTKEIFERKIILKNKLLKIYFGDKKVLKELLKLI